MRVANKTYSLALKILMRSDVSSNVVEGDARISRSPAWDSCRAWTGSRASSSHRFRTQSDSWSASLIPSSSSHGSAFNRRLSTCGWLDIGMIFTTLQIRALNLRIGNVDSLLDDTRGWTARCPDTVFQETRPTVICARVTFPIHTADISSAIGFS